MTKKEFLFNAIISGQAKDMGEAEALWKIEHDTQTDMVSFVQCLIDNKDMAKKELVRKLAEVSGYSESTSNHLLNALAFAKEYHKQMMA